MSQLVDVVSMEDFHFTQVFIPTMPMPMPVYLDMVMDGTAYSIHFSPNYCLLFAAHAHTIATCFAVVPRLCRLILVSLSALYLELYLHHISI